MSSKLPRLKFYIDENFPVPAGKFLKSLCQNVKFVVFAKIDAKTEKEVKIVLNIKFPPGKTFILESQKSDLYTALEGVKKSKGHIMINSYTDSSGSAAINLKLSKLRAAEVKKFFIENGIDPSRLIVKGWGATNPIADNSTREGRTKNRRIEIVIKVEE